MKRETVYTQNVLSGLAAAGTFTIPQQFFEIPRPGRALIAAVLILRGTAFDQSMITRTRWYSGSDVALDVRPIHERQFLERFTRQAAAPLANGGPGGGGVNTGILPFIFNDLRMESPGFQDALSFPMGKAVQAQLVLGSAPTAGSVDLATFWSDAPSPFACYRGATPINITNVSQNNQPFTWSVQGELLAYGIPWHSATVAAAIQKVVVIVDGEELFQGDCQAAVGTEALEANYLNAASICDPGSLSVVWKRVTAPDIDGSNETRNKIKFDVGTLALNTEEWAWWARQPQPIQEAA